MPAEPTVSAASRFEVKALKHAPTMAPEQSVVDRRSVGELLIDADHHARTLLLDAEAADAPGLLRAWPDTVAAATALWTALPRREHDRHDGHDGRTSIERVTELATSVRADLDTARWPGPGLGPGLGLGLGLGLGPGLGPGDGDNRLHAIAADLIRARELVEAYGDRVQLRHLDVRADVEAARTRVVHTLYMATHGVVVSLHQEGRHRACHPIRTEELRAAVGQRGRNEVGPGVRWADRLGVAERILGALLPSGRYADALADEQTAPILGLSRLSEALARFDIAAHRTLVNTPDPANLVLLTRTEGMFFGAALVLARAAAEDPHLNDTSDPVRVQNSLTSAGEAWTGLARRWRDLMVPGARLDPPLAEAAAQLRAACRELTHLGDHLAPTAVIGQRVNLTETLPVIARYVEAAADLAEATRPTLRDSRLLAPARAVLRRLADDIEDGRLPDTTDTVHADLITLATRTNPLIAVPTELLDALDVVACTASRTSTAAVNALGVPLVREEPAFSPEAASETTRAERQAAGGTRAWTSAVGAASMGRAGR